MNNQRSTDKAGSPRRLKIMKSDQTLYGILAGSEEKGRGAMETAVYATCILSVVAAIFQFVGQPLGSIRQRDPLRLFRTLWKQCGRRNPERRGEIRRIRQGRRAAPSAEAFGVAGRPYRDSQRVFSSIDSVGFHLGELAGYLRRI